MEKGRPRREFRERTGETVAKAPRTCAASSIQQIQRDISVKLAEKEIIESELTQIAAEITAKIFEADEKYSELQRIKKETILILEKTNILLSRGLINSDFQVYLANTHERNLCTPFTLESNR